MTKKAILPVSTEDTMPFDVIMAHLRKANGALPEISQNDKIGGKLSKKIAPLVDTATEYAASFEQYLPRKFETQEMIDAQAVIKANKLKIAALRAEAQHLDDNNTYLGIKIAKNYRIIYEASVKAAKDDASLKSMSDELGAAYQKPALSGERKAEIAQEKAAKTAVKAAVLAEKLATKIGAKTAKEAK